MTVKRFFSKQIRINIWKLINTIYWLIHRKNNIIVINSWIYQRWNRILPNNWGDDLNFYLVKKITGKKVINYSNTFLPYLKIKNYMCIGSVVEEFSNGHTIIWGSGAIIGGNMPIVDVPLSISAVRGPKTKEYLESKGIACPAIFGDPALLLSKIFPINTKKIYKLGIIPHYTEIDSDVINNYKNKYKDKIIIIDLKNYTNWEDILVQVNQCEYIISSSLHGLIISDSYGIPNVRIKILNKLKGGDFKFTDYFTSVQKNIDLCLDINHNNNYDINYICNYIDQNYKPALFEASTLLNACPFTIKKEYL